MKYFAILLVTFFLASVAAESDIDGKWEIFKSKFSRSYSNPREEMMRKKNFLDSIERLSALNTRHGSAKFGVTAYSDYSKEEKEQMLGLKMPKEIPQGLLLPLPKFSKNVTSTPIDWRSKNAVLPQVKDQKTCGSCWAFACAGALEGAYAIKSGSLLSFSDQDFLDCSNAGDCDGGNPFSAYGNLASNRKGVSTEDCYPYENKQGNCRSDANCQKAFPLGFYVLERMAEIEQYVGQYGPAIGLVSVDSEMGWFDYTSGVFNGPCGARSNHAVTIVGFTSDAWIIRNSWGEDWGDKGYMQIRKGKNTCFIEDYSLAPAL